jgi:hypothetical protein
MRFTSVYMPDTKRQLTVDPISYATPVAMTAEFMRLPKDKERDPLFGLGRGFLNTLILPSRANHHRPPVASCVLRQRGARTGVRLIDVASLRDYTLQHREPNSGRQPAPAENTNMGADI